MPIRIKFFFVRLSANIFFIHTIFMCGPTLIESGRVVLFVSGFLSKTLNGVYWVLRANYYLSLQINLNFQNINSSCNLPDQNKLLYKFWG